LLCISMKNKIKPFSVHVEIPLLAPSIKKVKK